MEHVGDVVEPPGLRLEALVKFVEHLGHLIHGQKFGVVLNLVQEEDLNEDDAEDAETLLLLGLDGDQALLQRLGHGPQDDLRLVQVLDEPLHGRSRLDLVLVFAESLHHLEALEDVDEVIDTSPLNAK